MRARSGLTGRGEISEVIGGPLSSLKVAGPSMLGIGCPDRHALPFTHSPPPPKTHPPRRVLPSRASGFVRRPKADVRTAKTACGSAPHGEEPDPLHRLLTFTDKEIALY